MTINQNNHIGEDETSEAAVAGEAQALFERLGDWGLGRLMELAQNEMTNRIKEAEKKVAEMKRHFRLSDASSKQAPFPRTQARKQTKGKSTNPSGEKKSASGKRGKLTTAIKEILTSGSKSRADIDGELKARQLTTQSLGTLLNRLKKEKVIKHDVDAKTYSISEDNNHSSQ